MKYLAKLTEEKLIYLLTAIAALVAWRVMYIQHGWINDDSTLYFEIAKRFANGQWREGWALFQWPFYPFLIAIFHQISTASLHLSAQILAVTFFCITAFSLSKLIQLAGGDKLTILCGNVLLLSSTYITGDVFSMLLRDQGFWAFFLTSLIFFIRFIRDYRLSNALLWQISIILATLFRVEALAYAFFLPFLLLLQPNAWLLKFRYFFKANALHIALIGLGLIVLLTKSSVDLSYLGRLNEIPALFSNEHHGSMSNLLLERAAVYKKEVLGPFLEGYALQSLTITLLCIVLLKCLNVAGSLNLLLLLSARKKFFSIPQQDVKQVLLTAAAIAALNATVIIFRSFVLSSRYVIAFGFIVILFAAFYLASLIELKQTKSTMPIWQTGLLIIVSILMTAGLAKNLAGKRPDYNYEQQALTWLKLNVKNAHNIYYDNARLRYYAGAPWMGRDGDTNADMLIQYISEHPNQYDCLVMRAEADEQDKLNKLTSLKTYQEIKRFTNKHGNAVLIMCKVAEN